MKYIISLDPGTTETGVCILDAFDYRPLHFGKIRNEDTWDFVRAFPPFADGFADASLVIEMVASYGMAVGREVFETCVWIGRFAQMGYACSLPVSYVYRKDEKLAICHSPKANDATIKQALVDRFAYGTPNHGKGSKASPGWFYGFGADVWSAYAVGVTYLDRMQSIPLAD